MPNRRTVLMTALGAAAVGMVTIITGLLRRTDDPSDAVATAPATLALPTDPNATAVTDAPPSEPIPTARLTSALDAQCPLPLITRQEWGALPPDLETSGERGRYNAATNPDGWLIYDQPLKEVLKTLIVHHSALPLDQGPREIQALHMHDKNFADVGYQYIIDYAGKLYEGRAMNVRGAHTYGHNYGAVGVCLIGNFQEIEPSAKQIWLLRAFIHCLLADYPNIQRLAGHRDYNPTLTQCPGNHLAELLPDLASEQGLLYGT